jgi:SpoVK/Ycf46/Vps4 family AAA+-type ATPase
VGRYIGETEENMKNLLEEARGNVLFIDEAYTLCDGAADRKDFGARAIECLLTLLAQPDPDMVVILAGCEKEMDAMLNSNPGLAGRFPNKFRFADYNAGQLMEIAAKLLQRDDYELTPEAGRVLQATIEQTLAQRTQNFGNARWMEQYILNGIVQAMADRLAGLPDAKEQDYRLIEAGDILQAFEKFNPKTIELRPRRQVGFCA